MRCARIQTLLACAAGEIFLRTIKTSDADGWLKCLQNSIEVYKQNQLVVEVLKNKGLLGQVRCAGAMRLLVYERMLLCCLGVRTGVGRCGRVHETSTCRSLLWCLVRVTYVCVCLCYAML